MHRPTSGRAGSLAFNIGMHIYKARTREVAPLRPGNRSPAKERREREREERRNEKEEKEETIKIGERGRHDDDDDDDDARAASSGRTDVVYFHARLTSAPEHSVEKSVTTRPTLSALKPASDRRVVTSQGTKCRGYPRWRFRDPQVRHRASSSRGAVRANRLPPDVQVRVGSVFAVPRDCKSRRRIRILSVNPPGPDNCSLVSLVRAKRKLRVPYKHVRANTNATP